MKKIKWLLLVGILSFSELVGAQTQPCSKDSNFLYVGSLRYNDLKKQEFYLKNKCVVLDDKLKSMVVKQTKTVDSVLLLEKYLTIDENTFKTVNNLDWLSFVVVKDLFDMSVQDKNTKEEEMTSKFIKSIGGNDFNFSWRQSETDKNKLIAYLSKKYSKGYTVNKDNFGNTSLIYMLVDNKPEYINNTYTGYGDKILWIKKNKNAFSALHYMFSPLLKNKNVQELNDKVLKEIPVDYYLNLGNYDSLVNGKESMYDYFQFAELMKENNIDFYKKLQAKYKAEVSGVVTSAEIIKEINNKLSLSNIDFN